MRADKLKDKSRAYFDQVAVSDYVIPEPVLCYTEVLKQLQNSTFDSLADISCGTGDMLAEVIDAFGNGKTLYGVDLSPNAAKIAREKTSGHAEIIVGDVDDIPLDSSVVDIALNMHSFHHYPNPAHALGEIHRILKPCGQFILVENDYPFLRRVCSNIFQVITRYRNGDIKMYSEKELMKLLHEADFKVLMGEHIADHSRMFVCRAR